MYSRITAFVSPDGRDEVSTRPEMLPDEVAFPLAERPGYVNCALPFDVADDLRHRVLWRDRDHHVHMVGHKMPFLDLALLLLCQRSEKPCRGDDPILRTGSCAGISAEKLRDICTAILYG
jgi:hypothetical protein